MHTLPMKFIASFLLFIASYTVAISQNKLLTIEDALVNNRTSLAVKNLDQLQFVYGTNDYIYLDKSNNTPLWKRGNMTSNSEYTFLTLSQLNTQLSSLSLDTFTAMPRISFNKSADWILTVHGKKVAINQSLKQEKLLVDSAISTNEVVDESSVGFVAFVKDNNLYVSDLKNTNQVTTDGSNDIVYGKSVHRDEFGISKGTFWSNNGKQLAFYRMDQSMVTDYPIIDWTTRPAKAVNIKYPMAGDKSHQVTVGIYNTNTHTVTYLKTGEPKEQYLTNIAWSPDDKFVYIAVLNREQNHMKLNQYDAATGAFVKTLFEEKDEKYVEPLVPILFVKNNPSQFIWQSNRDGWNHLYLYDTNGTLLKQLTKGEWEVTDVKDFDAKGENLFYLSTQASPITKNVYKLNLKTGKQSTVNTSPSVHAVQLNSTGKYLLDTYSDTALARKIQLIDIANGKSKTLFEAANPLKDYALGQMQIFTINNKQGNPLYCRMYKPLNFDASKRYPVIVYWYGGPHVQLITQSFNAGASDYWFQYLAEHGYVVFTLDPRGSDNRGKAWEQSIFRKAGDAQMEDMMSGIDYLHSLQYVDKNRMGLFGWSYGGFMTIDFMLNHPGIFKAAVAGGPVTDWKYYEIMYGERYMDTPQENPEGYAATDLTKQVDKLKGKLLLIHGLQDNVVVQQHSVNFVRAAIDKKVQVDYMIYPGHEHNVIGKDRAHLYQKVTDYFSQNLQ
jgi:dipeptidyl-peptidase 4